MRELKFRAWSKSMSETIKWSELTPRERDALVAEKVMRLRVEHWTQKEYESVDEEGNPVAFDLRTGYVLADEFGHPPVPAYTTDMNAACSILEHTAFIEAKTTITYDPRDCWVCEISFPFHRLKKTYKGWSETPAEAVCIAVLKSREFEVET